LTKRPEGGLDDVNDSYVPGGNKPLMAHTQSKILSIDGNVEADVQLPGSALELQQIVAKAVHEARDDLATVRARGKYVVLL
jgi:hypothetical protein